MRVDNNDWMINLSASDRVRLAHVREKLGGTDESVLRNLVHNFLLRQGVNNPPVRRALTSERFSCGQRV